MGCTPSNGYRHMNLAEMLNSAVGVSGGSFLPSLGSNAARVAERTKSENRANALIGSLYWQSYLASDAILRDVPSEFIISAIHSEPLVVFHGDGLFTLLLATNVTNEIVHFRTTPSVDELTDGLFRYLAGHAFLSSVEGRRASTATIDNRRRVHDAFDLSPRVLRDVLNGQPFHIAFAPLPAEHTSVPQPPLAVVPGLGNYQESTAGCWVQDLAGREGVTAAAHATPPGAAVKVGGCSGTVIGHDGHYTDSAFIEVHGASEIKSACRPSRGPLEKAPRPNDVCSFEGSKSGLQKTIIIACNLELPAVDLEMQQTVRTNRDTARGDSGAALLDDDGYILGFAHRRSPANSNPTWSSWIWGRAVFEKHGLRTI